MIDLIDLLTFSVASGLVVLLVVHWLGYRCDIDIRLFHRTTVWNGDDDDDDEDEEDDDDAPWRPRMGAGSIN